jgi:3-oxoadipate enol-lactonase
VGSDDHGTPPAMAQKIHEQIQGSVYHVIPEASHISNVEQTALFNQHLCDFYKIS